MAYSHRHPFCNQAIHHVQATSVASFGDARWPRRQAWRNWTFEVQHAGDPDAKLKTDGDLLTETEVYVSYTWPVTQRDLDSSTLFVGSSVGYANPGPSTYLSFSGDDTSNGGEETVYVDLYQSFVDGKWGGSVDVDMNAGWYIPAQGSGPALLTVGFYNTETGEYNHLSSRTISPGAQSGAASTFVGSAHVIIDLHDDGIEDDTVTLEFI